MERAKVDGQTWARKLGLSILPTAMLRKSASASPHIPPFPHALIAALHVKVSLSRVPALAMLPKSARASPRHSMVIAAEHVMVNVHVHEPAACWTARHCGHPQKVSANTGSVKRQS